MTILFGSSPSYFKERKKERRTVECLLETGRMSFSSELVQRSIRNRKRASTKSCIRDGSRGSSLDLSGDETMMRSWSSLLVTSVRSDRRPSAEGKSL